MGMILIMPFLIVGGALEPLGEWLPADGSGAGRGGRSVDYWPLVEFNYLAYGAEAAVESVMVGYPSPAPPLRPLAVPVIGGRLSFPRGRGFDLFQGLELQPSLYLSRGA